MVWLHVASDIVTGLAYFSIPVAMFYFAYKRRDLTFYKTFLLFATFILACGTTHFFAAYTVFSPAYWQEGSLKAITAIISALSAIMFIPLLPEALSIPSLSTALHENTQLNKQLELKVNELQATMQRLQTANDRLQLSENLLEEAQKAARIGSYVYDIPNDHWSGSLGLDDILGIGTDFPGTSLDWARIVHPTQRDEMVAYLRDIIDRNLPFNRYFRIRRLYDGMERWVHGCGLVEYGDDGTPLRMVGTIQDVTERRNAEEALRESESSYRLLFENMLEGFASCRMIYDEQGHPVDFIYLGVNKVFEALTGLRDVVGKRVSEVIPGIGESNPQLLESYGRVAITGQPEHIETFVPPLGIWFSISVYSTEAGCFTAVFDNITARKNAETAQDATIELLRICNEADNLRDLMRMVALYLQNLTGCEAVGVRLRVGDDFPYYEARGFTDDFMKVENCLCAYDQHGEVVRDKAGHPALECMCGNIIRGRFDPSRPYFTSNGSFWSSCTTELLASTTEADRHARTRNRCNGEGYESVALIPLRTQSETFGLFQFNDKRKGRFSAEKIALLEALVDYVAIALAKFKADEALRESNERFRMIFEHSIDAIMLASTDGTVLTANPEACRVFGMSEEDICRAGRAGLVDNGDERVVELLEQRSRLGSCRGEITMIRGDGSRFPAEISSAVFSDQEGVRKTSLVIRDVTERKSLEEQLRQSQKMEAVGTLAGGIAHDFNNILTAIVGYGTLLKMELKVNGKPQAYIDNLMALIERASNLTRGLLAFSRNQVMKPKQVNLNDIVITITKLIGRLIGENIEVETHLSASPLSIMADCGQIEQVLMNLATNARDAMPSGGKLTITTDVVTLEPDNPLLADSDQPGGHYALISVADTGNGMDEATMARIFEPFFTTKEPGKGTGLGLSILYGIIKQHHGFVTVASSPGSGTSFSIHVPLAAPAEAATLGKTAPLVAGGTETVLIAEDDPAIRKVISHVLQQFGYGVLEAADGEEAVETFRENASAISLVVLDVIMPRKNGKEAFGAMAEIIPDIKTLFVSGYPADVIAQRDLLPEGAIFLPKPVSPVELLRSIRQVLDGQ